MTAGLDALRGTLMVFNSEIKKHSCLQKEYTTGWWLVATQRLLMFTPNPGDMIQFDEHIFYRGWFNHQLDYVYLWTSKNKCWAMPKPWFTMRTENINHHDFTIWAILFVNRPSCNPLVLRWLYVLAGPDI